METGQELIEVEGYSPTLSTDEKFLAINYSDHRRDIYRHDVYDVVTKEKVFSESAACAARSLSSDSRYFVSPMPNHQASTLVDLQSGERWELQGSSPACSPDGQVCILTRMIQTKKATVLSDPAYCLEIIVVDLKSKKTIATWMSDAYRSNRPFAATSYATDGSTATVNAYFIFDGNGGTDPDKSTNKSFFIDLSFLKDAKFQDALNNQFTPEQSTFVWFLDETKQKKQDEEVSLLHDVALKNVVSLRNLEETLDSFHPLIKDGLIRNYKLVMAKKALEDRKKQLFWRTITKGAAFAGLMGALAWRYWSKRSGQL